MPRVTVGPEPQRLTLTINPPSPHTIVSGGESLVLQNTATSPVYLGDADVSVNDYGYELRPQESFVIDLLGGEHMYAVASSPTVINVFRPAKG